MKQKAEEFIQGFTNLRKQLGSDVAKDGLVVTLGIGAKVDTLGMSLRIAQKRALNQSE